MFGRGIGYSSAKKLLKGGESFCKNECHFYFEKGNGDCPGLVKYTECKDIAIDRTGGPNNWFKRIIRWITA